MVQGVPLIHREAPLVRSNKYEASPAFNLNQKGPIDGTVVSASKAKIKGKSGENNRVAALHVYNNLPLNRRAFIDSKPLVKRGDRVSRGQLLADVNYTLGGRLALGVNLTTAVMPYKGETDHEWLVNAQNKLPLAVIISSRLFNLATDRPHESDSSTEAMRDAVVQQKGRSLHSLRHTFALQEYFRTGDIYFVKQALGHSHVTITERYLKFPIDFLQQVFGESIMPYHRDQ